MSYRLSLVSHALTRTASPPADANWTITGWFDVNASQAATTDLSGPHLAATVMVGAPGGLNW